MAPGTHQNLVVFLAGVRKSIAPSLCWEAWQEGLSIAHIHGDLLKGFQCPLSLKGVSVECHGRLGLREDVLMEVPLVGVERHVVALEEAPWAACWALLKAKARILFRGRKAVGAWARSGCAVALDLLWAWRCDAWAVGGQ